MSASSGELRSVLFDDTENAGGDSGANWFLDSTDGDLDSGMDTGMMSDNVGPGVSAYHVSGSTQADFSNEPPLLEGIYTNNICASGSQIFILFFRTGCCPWPCLEENTDCAGPNETHHT